MILYTWHTPTSLWHLRSQSHLLCRNVICFRFLPPTAKNLVSKSSSAIFCPVVSNWYFSVSVSVLERPIATSRTTLSVCSFVLIICSCCCSTSCWAREPWIPGETASLFSSIDDSTGGLSPVAWSISLGLTSRNCNNVTCLSCFLLPLWHAFSHRFRRHGLLTCYMALLRTRVNNGDSKWRLNVRAKT